MFPPSLHELETEVMEEVWSGGERTVREVLDAINARSTMQRAYTTILTVMQRLRAKDVLRRERHGRRDVYVATLTREQYAQARAEAEVGALVTEYGDVALAHFARHMSRLDPKRREQIRRLSRGD
jgi:predicted transcriptional regulator